MQIVFAREHSKNTIISAVNGPQHVNCSLCPAEIQIDSQYFECNDKYCDHIHCMECQEVRDDQKFNYFFKIPVYKSYHLSYGYLIRFVWRLAAVMSRIIIFSLTWVVMGGEFLLYVFYVSCVLMMFASILSVGCRKTINSSLWQRKYRNLAS